MTNNQRNSNGLLFLIGAIAGGAAVYFLKSPRGQRMTEVLLERADELGAEIKQKATNVVDTVSSTADNMLSTANSAISSVQSKVVGVTNKATDASEETVEDFRQGVERAEAHIKERIENA